MELSFEKEAFRRAAIAWIRGQAPLLADTEDYRFLEAAAWLFAIGSEIRVRRPDVEGWELKPADSLPILAGRLRRLGDNLSWLDLYRELCEALLTVEMALDPKRDAVALDRPIALPPTLEGCSYPFGGSIQFWLHPPSALAAERVRRYEEAGEVMDEEDSSRPPAPRWRIQDHLLRLSVHWERAASPRLVRPLSQGDRAQPLIERSGADAVRGGFRIALCPLSGGSHPLFKIDDGGRYFRAQGINGLEELNRSLDAVIQAAESQDIHLVVLPELMVPSDARDILAQRLLRRRRSRPYGVLAGSFHMPAGSDQSEGPRVNEACLLDHRGRRVLRHQKQFGFRLRRREALPPFFPGGPPKSGTPPEIYEDIEDGSELAILDTTLGRLAMLICFDALAADPDHGFEELIRRVRPDLLFVLSMSTKTRPFEEVFKRMAEHWIGTAYVNAQCVCRPAKGSPDRSPLLACCDFALQEPGGAAPTRVLWRAGQATAECLYYGGKSHPEQTGVEVHPTLGLILDLGAHLRAPSPERERKQQGPP